MSNLPDRVQQTIASTLRLRREAITATTVNEDIAAWDSLGHVNIMMALEQTFDIYVEVEDFEKLQSVPSIMEYLAARGVR